MAVQEKKKIHSGKGCVMAMGFVFLGFSNLVMIVAITADFLSPWILLPIVLLLLGTPALIRYRRKQDLNQNYPIGRVMMALFVVLLSLVLIHAGSPEYQKQLAEKEVQEIRKKQQDEQVEAKRIAAIPAETRIGDAVRQTLKDEFRDLKVIKDAHGKYVVFVSFNQSMLFTQPMTKRSFEIKITDVMYDIYRLGLPIARIKTVVWTKHLDDYGNDTESVIFKATLEGKDGDRINWNEEHKSLMIDILSQHWETSGPATIWVE